jgi:hypothetical protein
MSDIVKWCQEAADEIERLRAEVEQLASAHADKAELVIRLQDRIDNAAAFLDGLAGSLASGDPNELTADCRAMAAKLRGSPVFSPIEGDGYHKTKMPI